MNASPAAAAEADRVNKSSPYWTLSPDAVVASLQTDADRGLSPEQIDRQRDAFGSNTIEEIKQTSALELVIESVKEPMMLVLLSIAGLSVVFGRPTEAVVMVFVVAAYVGVEFINKFRSDRVMARLKELTQPTTRVLREGQLQEIRTGDVVVGDIVTLSQGSRIPADLRLLETRGLQIDEASLTGETLTVQKVAQAPVAESAGPSDRINSAFSGTTVVAGEGRGVAVAVGQASELGHIATAVQRQAKQVTLIQQAMTRLAKTLAVLAVAVSLLIPAVGFLRGLDVHEMVLTWLALTFLMIPGQPPVIITMALALASFELARKNIVVKRLRGVEVLGQVSAIVTDKTGTLTENRMRVSAFVLPDGQQRSPETLEPAIRTQVAKCLPRYTRDPTDLAVDAAVRHQDRRGHYTMVSGFSDGHPWRTLAYRNGVVERAIAGEPERLIDAAFLSVEQKVALREAVQEATSEGHRVVAFAAGDGASEQDDSLNRVTLVALAILADPVRQGAADAVAALRKAGIRTYLATGDHPATAAAIARDVGIDGDELRGDQIEELSDEGIRQRLPSLGILARIAPTQKQRIVDLLERNGAIVAVIGDGVNDAPALKAANVGIAMGEIGTDLAKETADLVLTDDNYVHLPDAIAIGRKALDNFRKGLTYYLTAKAVLLAIFLVPLALGIPFPLAPIHIILTELLMDLASSTIFVTEAVEPDVLTRPAKVTRDFLNWRIAARIARNGLPLAAGILAIYLWLYYSTTNVLLAQTASFTTWLLGHIMLALNLKQEQTPLLRQGLLSNRFAVGWLIGMIGLSVAMTTVSLLQKPLNATALPVSVWGAVLVTVIVCTWWIELLKWRNVRAGAWFRPA